MVNRGSNLSIKNPRVGDVYFRCQAIFECNWWKKKGDRGINTKELFQNLVLPNSAFSYIDCIVTFSYSM